MNSLMPLAAAARLLLGAPPSPPQTTVELRVTSVDDGEAKLIEQALLRQIGDRLLEDGYRLVPPGASAGVRVWIHLDVDEATIETSGDGRERERVADADPEIMVLELQQLTTALVDAVRPAAAQPVAAVVVEVLEGGGDPQLRAHLQSGLLERGFALTRTPGPGDLRLCVSPQPEGVVIDAIAGTEACAAAVGSPTTVVGVASVEIVRELILDEAAASLGRFAAAAEPALATEPAPAIAAEPAPSVSDLPPAADPDPSPSPPIERPPPSLALAASGGLFGRGGGADPLAAIDLRAGRRRGLGGGLGLALVPSSAASLRVIEWLPTATFDWRLGFAGRGLAILGLFAGAHVHTYSRTDTSAGRGVRVGPSVGASVRLGYLGRRGALLFGGVRTGWSGGRWIHLDDGEQSWRRSGVVVGLELGVGWDFALGGRR